MANQICGFFAAVCLFAASAYTASAAPSVSGVSGNVANGQKLTLNGTNFGTKPQASPLVYDDFESGVLGATVTSAATVGTWTNGIGSPYVKYSNARVRPGSTRSSLHDFKLYYGNSLEKAATFPYVYLDFWVNINVIDNRSRNYKVWRMFDSNITDLQLDWVYACTNAYNAVVDETARYYQNYWDGRLFTPDTWMHFQVILKQSSPGVADGTIKNIIDSVPYGANSSAVKTRGSNLTWDLVRIGHYWGTGAVDNCPDSTEGKVYFDDVYVDNSWARVELGNAPTYSESTHREIQVPLSWAGQQIEVRGNTGSFQNNETAYLFVTDANGITQPTGFPVHIGATNVPPKSPQNVTVQ